MSDYIEVNGLRVGPCMWRNLKEELTAARDEAERLRARVAELSSMVIESGCYLCGGDCSAANPPVSQCPMALADRYRKEAEQEG